MAVVPAHHAIAVGIGKAIRDRHGMGDGMVLATHTEIADTVAAHLASRNCRELLTRFVTELHAASLDTEPLPKRKGDHG